MNKEILLDEKKEIISTTDSKGIILDSNAYFAEISGFEIDELIGEEHNIIRHPDMPRVIFRMMWTHLLKDKKNFRGVIKNKAKGGDYYWVITDFNFEVVDDYTIYTAVRKLPDRKLVKKIDFIYKRMIQIEKEFKNKDPMKASEKFLNDIIFASGYNNYDEFIDYLTYK